MANFNLKALQGATKTLKGIALKNRNEVQKSILFSDNKLYAGNSEIGLVLPMAGSLLPEEAFLIPDKAFEIISALNGDEVSISLKENKLILTCGKAKTQVQTHDLAKYVTPVSAKGKVDILVDAALFMARISSVLYCVDENNQQKAFTGVHIKGGNGILQMAGCTGSQIAVAEIPYDQGDFEVTVPKQTVSSLLRLPNPEGKLGISITKKTIAFKTSTGVELTGRLIEESFFDYEKIMSSQTGTTCVVNKLELLDALSRVNACLSTEDKKPVIMNFSETGLTMSFTNNLSAYEETLENIKLGSDLKIAFNSRFLASAMQNMTSPEVQVQLSTAHAPALISEEGCRALLLPVAL